MACVTAFYYIRGCIYTIRCNISFVARANAVSEAITDWEMLSGEAAENYEGARMYVRTCKSHVCNVSMYKVQVRLCIIERHARGLPNNIECIVHHFSLITELVLYVCTEVLYIHMYIQSENVTNVVLVKNITAQCRTHIISKAITTR